MDRFIKEIRIQNTIAQNCSQVSLLLKIGVRSAELQSLTFTFAVISSKQLKSRNDDDYSICLDISNNFFLNGLKILLSNRHIDRWRIVRRGNVNGRKYEKQELKHGFHLFGRIKAETLQIMRLEEELSKPKIARSSPFSYEFA